MFLLSIVGGTISLQILALLFLKAGARPRPKAPKSSVLNFNKYPPLPVADREEESVAPLYDQWKTKGRPPVKKRGRSLRANSGRL